MSRSGEGASEKATQKTVEHELAHLKHGGAFLFLSFDMVNSTEYKAREQRWPFVLHCFYRDVVAEIRHVSDKFNVWKYIGDEVVFWRHLIGSDDLVVLVRGVYRAIKNVIAKIDALDERYGLKTRNFLGVKATMWVAAADHIPGTGLERHLDGERRHSNRIIRENHLVSLSARSAVVEQSNVVDFIGPDIDIGFRISKFAHNRFLLLSAYLGYVLLKGPGTSAEIGEHVKIIAYESLKGVWGGRPYPILWYCDDWTDVASQFAYDEPFCYPQVARVCEQRIWPLSHLVKVLSDTNNIDGAEALVRQLNQTP